MAATMIAACSKTDNESIDPPQNNPEQQPTEQPEAVTVSFAMKGEYTIEERPLSRAAGLETNSRDLYGINIYYDKEQDGKINDPYGYGLFDNVEDMVVTLLTGYKYRFVCSFVKEGKDKIMRNYYDYGYGFFNPFERKIGDVTSIQNKFVLGTNDYLNGLGSGLTYAPLSYFYSSGYYPLTDRYYGETTDYTPKEGGVVSIDMKRVVFGMQFEVSGISDGSFSFEVVDANVEPEPAFSKGDITSDTTFEEEIHTYRYVYACWQNASSSDNYSQDFTINMTWVRGNGVTQTLNPLKVTFKRNVMTTVRINLNGGDKENSFDLKLENTDMGKEEKDFDVDAGDMTDTPVDPKP